MSAIGAFAAGAGEGLLTSAFNMVSAEQSRDYNREMASTAHQREVADLRKAGLNPVCLLVVMAHLLHHHQHLRQEIFVVLKVLLKLCSLRINLVLLTLRCVILIVLLPLRK